MSTDHADGSAALPDVASESGSVRVIDTLGMPLWGRIRRRTSLISQNDGDNKRLHSVQESWFIPAHRLNSIFLQVFARCRSITLAASGNPV